MTVAQGLRPAAETDSSTNGSLQQPTESTPVNDGTTLHGLSTPRAMSPEPEPEAEQPPTDQKPRQKKRKKARGCRIFAYTAIAIAVVAYAASLGMKKAVEV